MKKLGDFIMGKGFYIALLLCVATIGVSGYYLYSELSAAPLSDSAGGQAQVELPTGEGQAKPPVVSQTDPRQQEKDAPKPQPVKVEPQPKPEPEPEPEQPTTAPVSAPPVYTWPVKGEVFSDFSLEVLAYDETMGDWRTHSGVDIAAAVGTRVLALSNGTVTRVYEDDLMGTSVVIDHGDGLVSTYQNLSSYPTVAEGDSVVTGTVIGAVGDTAIAESGRPPHLHLEVMLDQRSVDPIDYLPQY
ncbi:MAG: M23 family metallopeptidase [Ruminococcaceae bacterium]|nr:M23 family metallopeptidase [Oscillospiraceae bacterium]